ncbi:hypothetical protein [Paenibacillus sp. LK1]|uniref:hypothetical protein n=1 Tax=Paenibacillus sp. LK1 TaxID=2053014 RepID=UPI000C1A5505|nr:hypothetical protein [Paenibacillus sp. LK1]PIH59686.1 hypothetical protein CS562_07030 [Paenibacillus sp. LK1]
MSEEIPASKYLEIFKQMKLIGIDNNNRRTSVVNTYTKVEVKDLLKTRENRKSQQKLRIISKNLYEASGHYKSLINYFSTLHTMDHIVEPLSVDINSVNVKKYRKEYEEYCRAIEQMDIANSFSEARMTAYMEGVFYGYTRVSKDGFYIQKLDPDYCKISGINSNNGLLVYSFDFSYFDINPSQISSFPDEFKTIQTRVSSNKQRTDKWEVIDSPFALCIKTSIDYNPTPAFASVFEGILDIADFKSLAKTKEEIDNFMLLLQKIPMKSDEADKYMLNADTVFEMDEALRENTPDQVSSVTGPMDITAIKFEKDSFDKNKVGQATEQLWEESGVSGLLFNTSSNTTTALKYSLTTDEASAFRLIKSIEVWCNAYLISTLKTKYPFKLDILPATKHNRNELLESALKAANSGFSTKNEIMALRGYSPNAATMNSFLENEILNLPDKLIPLSSAHTSSSDSSKGQPEKPVEKLSESGVKTRENESNEEV